MPIPIVITYLHIYLQSLLYSLIIDLFTQSISVLLYLNSSLQV